MQQQPTKKPGWLRSLFDKFRSSDLDGPDLLLHGAVDNALAQLTAFSQQKSAMIPGGTGRTALSCAHNAFGFHLFQMITEQAQQNVFISPTSIALALSMAYNGANGQTQTEMAQTLHLREMNREELNKLSASMMEMHNDGDTEVELSIANSLWMKDPDRILPEFQELAQKYFQAELGDLAQAPDAINRWASQRTRGKINRIVGKEVTDEDVHAVLMNAIYFRGRWTVPFEPRDTHESTFTLQSGRTRRCKMMSQRGSYYYLEHPRFQAIRLPYGEQNLSMLIFLPSQHTTYSEFLSSLTSENWLEWRGAFQFQEGSLWLPRFHCEYITDLNLPLSNMGMPIAFDQDRADFSRLSHLFYLGLVRHKAIIDVKEEGTEAAAVTEAGALYGSRSSVSDNRFTMIVDRPFFCAIVDERTDAILFMGAIAEPD